MERWSIGAMECWSIGVMEKTFKIGISDQPVN
jgi:hypothetical protein